MSDKQFNNSKISKPFNITNKPRSLSLSTNTSYTKKDKYWCLICESYSISCDLLSCSVCKLMTEGLNSKVKFYKVLSIYQKRNISSKDRCHNLDDIFFFEE